MNRTIISIIAITLLEALAIWKGIDGALMGVAFAAIAGLGGYQLAIHRSKKK